MNLSEEHEIKKEFQLERVVLFSDAVFAIIITIMVIDLKLPETIKEASNEVITKAFTHLWLKFIGYGLSFGLVAMFWIRHIKVFSYLKDYNKTLLILNLFFLFCVSLFPFAISLITGAVKPDTTPFMWGFNIYICLLLATTFTQTALTYYLIKNKATLCVATDVIDYQLKVKILKWNLIAIPLVLLIIGLLNYFAVGYSLSMVAMMIYGVGTARLAKKFYPESDTEGPLLIQLVSRLKNKTRKAKLPPGN